MLKTAQQAKIIEQNEKQKLSEELAELKYKLAESKTKSERISANLANELTNKEIISQASQKDLEKIETATSSLSNLVKNLSQQYNIEISPKYHGKQ